MKRRYHIIGLSLLPFFLFIFSGYSQIFYNQQNIRVGSDVTLVLGDDLINAGSIVNQGKIEINGSMENRSVISNNGIIALTGDWTNSDTYNAGTGTVHLTGFADQTIDNNQQAFFGLVVDSGGKKRVVDNLSITGGLSLQNGILKTGLDSNQFILVADGAQISGGSQDSYVDGILGHMGNGFKFFPIGTNGKFLPAILEDVTGIDPLVGMTVIEPNPPPTFNGELLEVSRKRFWVLEFEGDFRGSPITLSLNNDSLSSSEGLVVAEADTIGLEFHNLGSSVRTDLGNLVTSQLPARGGVYALGITSGIREEDNLFVPNAFYPSSPDPDDRVVKVYGSGISTDEFFFKIFNRWGKALFETASAEVATTQGWDGTDMNGDLVPPGVYKYQLIGQLVNGSSFSRFGSVILVQ